MAYQNGKLPASALAPIYQGNLAKDNWCAASWNAMNVEARAQGCQLVPTGSKSSYRTYAQQEELYRAYLNGTGNLAAVPGTSNHGWGLAVDLATYDMRDMLDRVGQKYGWAKQWSDAPSEWWHIKYKAGVWQGNDPGPAGKPAPPPELPEDTVALAIGTMTDGRIELFVEDKNGQIWHAYQAKEGGWAGAEKGKNNAWYSMGTPGGGK